MTCPATTQADAAPTSLPLMVRNRQPNTETGDAEVTARLVDWFGRAHAFIDGYTPADDAHLPDPDTSLSRTQLLSLLIGFTVFQLRILSRMQFASAAVKEGP